MIRITLNYRAGRWCSERVRGDSSPPMLPYIASIENGRVACFCCGMIFQTPSIDELDSLIRRRRGRAHRVRVRGYERHLVQLSPHRRVRERASGTSARAAPHGRRTRRVRVLDVPSLPRNWHWRQLRAARACRAD
jgi:hypothetical protein